MSRRPVRHLAVLMILMVVATPALAGAPGCLPVPVCVTPGGNGTALGAQLSPEAVVDLLRTRFVEGR